MRRVAVIATAVAAVAAVALVSLQATARPTRSEALLDKAEEIARDVSALRGLRIKRSIDRGVMSRAQIRARVLERIDEEYTPEELRAEGLALERLGMLPAGTDYKAMVLDILTDQIAGFYDPAEKKLYIAGWQQPGGESDMVMAHEIAHALADQHFGLEKFLDAVKDHGDALVARQSLVEGEGMAVMIELALKETDPDADPWASTAMTDMVVGSMRAETTAGELGKAPLVVREGLAFPYFGGLAFVAHFRRTDPWKRIDRIYRRPPLSTEHILHPEAYERYERPDRVRATVPEVLDGWKEVHGDVSGELGLSLFFRQHRVATAKAEIAAAGWGGDRVVVYAPEDHARKRADGMVAIWYTVWDHEADAEEAFEAASDAARVLAGGDVTAEDDGYIEVAMKRGGGAAAVERKDDAVVIVIGADAAILEELRGQVWAWKVRRR